MADVNRYEGRKGNQQLNTLSLDGKALQSLLDHLDSQASPAEASRRHVRRAFRKRTLPIRVQHAAGSAMTLRVVCRNISSGGISVLHNAYLHPGARCATVLQHRVEGPTIIHGEVVRCQHRGGIVYELGIKFDEPIDIKQYVTLDPFTDWFSLEHVDPDSLEGCAVYVEPSELDQRLVQHFLRGTRVRLRTAGDSERGQILALEGCDILLVNETLEDGTSCEQMLRSIRDQGCTTPVVILSVNAESIRSSNEVPQLANAFLSKPISQEALLRAIGEFLIVRTGEQEQAAAAPEGLATDIAREFVHEMQRLAERIDDAIRRNAAEECRGLCIQLQGAAPPLGFPEIGRLAGQAAEAVGSSDNLQDSLPPLKALRNACTNAQAA